MTTFRITGPEQMAHALGEIAKLPMDGTKTVTTGEYRRRRSRNQNRLLWLWNGEWAKDKYETDVELQHLRLKWRYGKHIFIVEQPKLVDMVAAIDAIVGTPEYTTLAMCVAANMRSSKLKVGPMNEYLSILETEGRQQGIPLTITGDLYEEAKVTK